MPWFRVDDTLHSHPKIGGLGLAAVGLWTISGSYSASYLTDGFIPQTWIRKHGGSNGAKLAAQLVNAGLWYPDDRDGENGWSFHDWAKYQPIKADVERRRQQTRERVDKHRCNAVTNSVTNAVTNALVTPPPTLTQPNPSVVGLGRPPHQSDHSPAGAASAKSARAGPPQKQNNPWQTIENCDLCDDDGRKPNGMVCDHIDRRFTTAKGTKQVRETMGWKT